jgi:hypothetical protein
MPAGLIEAWVKVIAAFQLRQFGNLSVQEDLRLVEEEVGVSGYKTEASRSDASLEEPDRPPFTDGLSEASA